MNHIDLMAGPPPPRSGRGGRAAGAGFYEYADGKRLGLWDGLVDNFGGTNLEDN